VISRRCLLDCGVGVCSAARAKAFFLLYHPAFPLSTPQGLFPFRFKCYVIDLPHRFGNILVKQPDTVSIFPLLLAKSSIDFIPLKLYIEKED